MAEAEERNTRGADTRKRREQIKMNTMRREEEEPTGEKRTIKRKRENRENKKDGRRGGAR